MVETDRFREAMRRMASGVSVITTDGPAGRFGVTVSSLCSLSLEPPSVLACVHHLSPALRAVIENGVFCANVLCVESSAPSLTRSKTFAPMFVVEISTPTKR